MTAEIRFDLLERRLEHAVAAAKPDPGLSSAGGGGTYDGMEGRVGALETDFKEMRTQLTELRISFARLEERVAHLPGKGFIVTVVMTFATLSTALITLGPKLAQFLVG